MWRYSCQYLFLIFCPFWTKGADRKEISMLRTNIYKIVCILLISSGLAACSNKNRVNGWESGNYAPGSVQEFQQAVGDRVFFELDSSSLNSASIATLNKQYQWLQQNSRYRVLIEGHADERGTREYNYSLGARRAQAVRDYLVSKGVSSNKIRTISYGKERPVAVCNDITCWSQNRRAVTVLE